MGVLNKVKNRRLVKRNVIWTISRIFLWLTAVQCLVFAVQGFVIFFKMPISDIPVKYCIYAVFQAICVVMNVLAVFMNRRYVNIPISILSVVFMLGTISLGILNLQTNYILLLSVVPALTVIFCVIALILQFCSPKKGEQDSLIKVAKVKPDFDFQPEDMIDHYKMSLKEIEDRYDMGNRDRQTFEKEKEELMQDMYHILNEFVGGDEVSLIYKLETLYQAKNECIISEDNYLMWKTQIIKDHNSVRDAHMKNEELLENGSITKTEYDHREELIKDEL